MKYLDKNGNKFVKGTSNDIVLAFDENNRSRWQIDESGLISLYLNDILVLSFTVDINIRDDEFLTFPFRPVPVKATLFHKTHHTQDWSIPERKQKNKPRKPKLVYDEDEKWEIGMEFHYRIPLGRLNFKTSIQVPLHGRTCINVWSDQQVRVNINYINSQEVFECYQEDLHKFKMLIGSTPIELPL